MTTLPMKLRFSNSCCCTARAVTLPRASSSGISVRPARVRMLSTRLSPTSGEIPLKVCSGWVWKKLSLLFCTQSLRTAIGRRSIGVSPGTGEAGSRRQSQSLREPSSTTSPAAPRSAARAGVGVQRSSCAASTSGTTLTSAYSALPARSAAMVLTQGVPSPRSATWMSATLLARLMASQVALKRWLPALASCTA